MKAFLFGASVAVAMKLGWEVGEWMQARFGLLQSFALWSLLAAGVLTCAVVRGRGVR